MIHAFWSSIGWHAGTTLWHALPAVLAVSALGLWGRHMLRRLRRSLHRGGQR